MKTSKLTQIETKNLVKEYRNYTDGGAMFWIECMAAIDSFGDISDIKGLQNYLNNSTLDIKQIKEVL